MDGKILLIDTLLTLASGGLSLYFLKKGRVIDETFSASWRYITVGTIWLFLGFCLQTTRSFPVIYQLLGFRDPDTVEFIANIVFFPPSILLIFNGVRQWFPIFSALERGSLGQARLYLNLVQEANSIFLRWDTDGTILFINRYGEEFFGYPRGQLVGKNVIGTIVPETESSGRDLVAMIEDLECHPENYQNNENENITASGDRVWVLWRNTSVINDTTGKQELISIGIDVTERRQVQDALYALAESIGTHVEGGDAVEEAIINLARAYNAKYAWYGLFKDEHKDSVYVRAFWDGEKVHYGIDYNLNGTPCMEVLEGRGDLFGQGIMDTFPESSELEKYGVESYFGAPLRNSAGEVIGIIAVMDVKPMRPSIWSRPVLTIFANRIGAELERKASEDYVFQLAHYDTLTGLPNRLLFQDRLNQLIEHARNNGQYLILLFLDLDRFKHVNDSIGHACGDILLREAAARLKYCVRSSDTISRMGGDEFTVVLSDIRDEAHLLKVAVTTAEKFIKEMARPFYVEGRELFVSASIGISVFPQDGQDIDYLMRNADIAMYHAKDQGGGTFEFFRPAMNKEAEHRIHTEARLRKALTNDEFLLLFQPIINLENEQVSCVEALLRWQDPERGRVKPDDFIQVAEDSGLIVPIGDWVLRQACEQLSTWRREGVPIERISVNIALRQLERSGFTSQLEEVMAENQVSPEQLIIEVTEGGFMDDGGAATLVLMGLYKKGFSIAIDDFGTGFSSLGRLHNMPVKALKIDRSFINQLHGGQASNNIVTAILSMGDSLGLDVVAEGVETVEQLEFLRSMDCKFIQGFYFSEPLEASDCADYAKEVAQQLQAIG